MGYFVPPNIYCNLVIPTLEENPTAGHLKVFAAILRSSAQEELLPELSRISHFLQEKYICQSRKFLYQMEILSCCRSLLHVCKEHCNDISNDLFTVIFTTLAMSAESLVKNNAIELLELLAKVENLENLNQLYKAHIRLTLNEIQYSPESWILYSYEFYIFQACLTYAKAGTYDNLDLIHPILKSTTSTDGDKKVRLKQYILLSNYLEQWDRPLEDDTDFVSFANIVLETVIIPGLTWKAGRSAEAIRTASVCCLCALLNKIVDNCEDNEHKMSKQKKFVISVEHFGWLFDKVRPILVTLMEDDAFKSRLYSLQAICLVTNIGQEMGYIKEEHIHPISPEIITHLEDSHDEVRLAAIEALREIWRVLPKDYDLSFSYVHIEYVYTKTLIHLDDPGEKFQKETLGKKFAFDWMKTYQLNCNEVFFKF
jgi:dynein assembly factor 5